jgi:hypothetical protein
MTLKTKKAQIHRIKALIYNQAKPFNLHYHVGKSCLV